MRGDLLEKVRFGVLLIILASTLILFPETPSELLLWLNSWRVGPAILPRTIICPLIYLLTLTGIWNFLKAGLRLWTKINPQRGVMDSINGILILVVTFLLREYSERLIPITALIPSIIICLGLTIIIRSAASYILEGGG